MEGEVEGGCWKWGRVRWGEWGEGVSGSCRHLFLRQSLVYRCTHLYIRTPHCSLNHTRFLFNTKWRDEVIKLVSGYHTDSKIYMLSFTEYVISWVISPLLYSPSVSPVPVSVSPHRAPSETKQSATNSRVANIGPADSLSDNMRFPCLLGSMFRSDQHGMQIFTDKSDRSFIDLEKTNVWVKNLKSSISISSPSRQAPPQG